MMGLLNENNQNLINEGIEGKRCWYYKKMAERGFEVDPSKVPDLYEGAFQVQRFLNYVGHDIPMDYTFGNKTATALGTWAYGSSKGIDTVDKLWRQMKKDGWDVGETTGYGGKMVKAVADMIIQVCQGLAKTCTVDQQTLFDMEFKMLEPYETECSNFLDKQYEKAIQYWKNYLNSEGFKKRIKNKEPNIDNKDIFSKVYDMVFNLYWGTDGYSLDTIINIYNQKLNSIKGWQFSKELNITFKMKATNPISVNKSFYCWAKFDKNTGKVTASEENLNESYSSFVHEITHILDEDNLNDIENIKKAYPLTTDHYSDKEKDTKIPTSKVIPIESKKELSNYGVDYKRLSDWANQEGWSNSYWCDKKEKISNLNSFRAFLVKQGDIKIGDDMTVSIFTKYLKKYLNKSETDIMEDTDFQQLIVCWVQNNFTPKLSEFISELNSLAKEEGNVEKDYKDPRNINKGETT